MKWYNFVIVLLVCISMCSCRSTSKVSECVTNGTLKVTTNDKVLDVKSEVSNVAVDDSSETVSITIITEYDTDKVDANGQPPVKRKTATVTGKKKGSKKKGTTETKQNISATKEESAEQVIQENNRREDTRAETKQPLYFSYILFGVAFVILMAVLAYWVFTKYRAAKPQGK